MNGIFLVDKPAGITSHDVVYQIRKKFNIKKVGHTGTLDPFATGLLIIMVGKATKLAFLFDELDKKYEGIITLGKAYDTDDTTGKVIDEALVHINQDVLDTFISQIKIKYSQIPPSYSAIKNSGIKAYEAARSGNPLKLAPRDVKIYDFTYNVSDQFIAFDTHVSKGTYIRSIARDLGHTLNTFGALSKLNRTMIGTYLLKDAKTIDQLELTDLIEHTQLFLDTPSIVLNDYMIKLVKNGVNLDERQTSLKEPFIVKNEKNEYIAYYKPEGLQYKVKYFF